MPRVLTTESLPDELTAKLRRGARVYAPGCAGHSPVFERALSEAQTALAGVTLFGVWIPGVNHADFAGLHQEAAAETIFLSPALQDSFVRGQVRYRPMTYSQCFAAYRHEGADLALLQVSLPDAEGMCSLGVAADFTPAVLHNAKRVVAHLNPLMPATRGAAHIPLSRFDAVVETPAPLLTYASSAPSPVFQRIARHIAALVRDGDTLQFGLGNTQSAVLQTLAGHRRLKIHAGMISESLLGLLDGGVLDESVQQPVTTGVALGSPALYQRAGEDTRIGFADVGYTHAQDTLARIPRLIAVNSCIEVDLTGQANAETMQGRQVSGGGGLLDFLRGAALSPGGVPILALPASAGPNSRIVPRLADGVVTVPRTDCAVVVTEHGAADLRGLDLEARAAALIAIAAPAHRDSLTRAWREMRKRL